MNKRTKKTTNGFGLQVDIENEEAVLQVRISNPRRLNIRVLGETLMKFFRGGYKTVVLSRSQGVTQKVSLLEFLGRLQALYQDSRLFSLETRLLREGGLRGVRTN
ncbi:hypothetical protein ACIPJG_32185 [Streptomyces halstedii]|uniref:hypothetical protein n=1 Tax=Streptomyces halstedii TaxID=1944 RepID=UPI00380D37FB